MQSVSVYIDKLKIVDCADDDEDMDLRLAVHVVHTNGQRKRVYAKRYPDVYVEEEGKIGNESRCSFFGGERVENIAAVDKVEVTVHLQTLDSDGFDWGGVHTHSKDVRGLPEGRNAFVERKEQSSNTAGRGVYELYYTVFRE